MDISKYLLAEFIAEFSAQTDQKGINIIAHSMGCRCLIGAVEVLSNTKPQVLKQINQVILAAADIDTRQMDLLGPHAVKNCKRTTSYAAPWDKALGLSKWFHGHPRVGIAPPAYVLNGMDTILVNNLDLGDLGHGYVASSRTVLSDIFSLLKGNAGPSDRHSVELVHSGPATHWKIRE